MEHHTTTSRAEAERLMGIAEKLLSNKDLSGARDFAILAQETEPLLEGSDQILAVAEVLLAADIKLSNNKQDWYSIIQIPQRTNDAELIKKQYRRLALLLHPDKNKFPFADSAFRLVADAWAVLSDPGRKNVYDSEIAAVARFSKVDLAGKKQGSKRDGKLPVRRSGNKKNTQTPVPRRVGNFWTSCPYCHNLYEYPRVYEGCCLRCDNEKCGRAFTAAEILSMPPLVPGMEAYYCCWGVFPMGFVEKGGNADGFAKWMPPMFGDGGGAPTGGAGPNGGEAPTGGGAPNVGGAPNGVAVPLAQSSMHSSGAKKRGRPRKNV